MIRYLTLIFFFFFLAGSIPAEAQASSQIAFNQAANYFIDGQNQQALQTVTSALKKHPNDPKLQALKKKLEEQQKQQQQNQQNKQQEGQNQENKEGEQKESEGKNKEQKEEKEGKPENKKGEKEGEGEKKEEEKPGEGEPEEEKEGRDGEENKENQEENPGAIDTEKRLEEMNISPEKARMILEAMKSNEVQYLQQKKRRQSRPDDDGRPDW